MRSPPQHPKIRMELSGVFLVFGLPVRHKTALSQEDEEILGIIAQCDGLLPHEAMHHVLLAGTDLVLTLEDQDASWPQDPLELYQRLDVKLLKICLRRIHTEPFIDNVALSGLE